LSILRTPVSLFVGFLKTRVTHAWHSLA
jgi:hypothetical protein